jgi:diguanylate cyclase (GGDEF)-like protein/PAS domain S-box-containing protein
MRMNEPDCAPMELDSGYIKALRQSELRYRRLFETARDGILLLNAQTAQIEDVNPYLIEMLGYSYPEFMGKKLWEVGAFADVQENKQKFSELQLNGYVRYDDLPLRTKAGVKVSVEFVSNMYDCEGTPVIQCNIRDITARRQAEERITELAFFDPLTHLPNRTLLMDRLKQAMVVGARNATCGAVLFLDLDHFKTLNDTLGHDKGDMLLQQVAHRLTACVREGDTVARLGGDEFVVILESLHANPQEAATQTRDIGEKIILTLNQPYRLGDMEQLSTASMGATLFCGQSGSIEDLLKQADLAMYKSKETGRNGLRFFDPLMQTSVLQRVSLERELRHAIAKQEFVLYFQAQVVGDVRVTGAEVLLRWRHPSRGLMNPAEFIGLAEETGLIVPLGQWVIDAVCKQLAIWAKKADKAHLTLAVNVSVHQFRRPDFVESVLTALKKSGANPQRLKLELTESLLVDNMTEVIEKMFVLKAKGVGFSLDDFGTGYSSLAYLKRMPLDQLKIDRSFVRDILSDNNDASIARTIITLCQSLGLSVIAEGVEIVAQRDFLASCGCHAYQGNYFSKPLLLQGFERYARVKS